MPESPQQRPPEGPKGQRGPSEAPGFNWRLAILLGAAFVILGFAFFNNGSSKQKSLSYSEFRTKWDQGLIVVNDPKRPLQVVTAEGAADAKITGWINPERYWKLSYVAIFGGNTNRCIAIPHIGIS